MKTYKVWARQTTYHYAFVEAKDDDEAFDIAMNMDGSEYIDGNQIDWDIYSVEAVSDAITGEKS